MTVKRTVMREPPLRNDQNTKPMQYWFLGVQTSMPLIEVDTTLGNEVITLPPAGLDTSTGQSSQGQELTYVKISADGNTVTINGAQLGAVVLVAQGDRVRFKSNGVVWWPIS